MEQFMVLDLPLHRYLWDIAKSTTRAERLSCAAAITALLVCIILIVYFNVAAKRNADSIVDVAPHEWFITREMWLAPAFLHPNSTTEFSPLKLVIIAHTVSAECTVFANCAAELRVLQSYYAANYEYDMPYNFVIGNEGRVYEARGWNRTGAHSLSYNRCSLGLAFIGDYGEGLPSNSRVTDLQLLRAQMLFKEGVRLGYLHKDFRVLGAKDVIDTLSPGTNLYRAIQKWHNYDHERKFIGQTCEFIHGFQPSAAAQTATLPPTFKNLTAAPHEWFITREMWLAPPFINQNATTEFAPLKLVIIAHTVSAECTVFMTCAAELRALQSYFATEFEYDIPYNFLIGNDGRVYEGRGWNRVGAHTFGYNPCTLSIAFIGDYREGLPSYSKVTDLQLKRAQMLLAEGVERGYLQSDYHVVGQKDVIPTLSPGANLYREIQKWKHYNTQYAGKSCEAIHGVNETIVAAQTEALPSTFKNLKAAPHEWFITREMWLAPPFINQNATTEFAPLKLVIIAHTVSAECTVFMTCAAELRALQSYFATEFEYDIPYNFLIGNDGRVYEGRGWNRVGAHTFGYNPCTLSIAFIGDYREGLPSYSKVTDLQLKRAQMLLAKGVELGYLQSDYHVVGQKDVIPTLSPGANLYREIQKWKHYNTQYAGKSCEAIHGVNETIVAAQTEALPSTFKNLKAAPHEWFITREMWLAPPFINQNATTEFAPLKLVIIAHTLSAECTVFMTCAAELRAIQSYFATEFEYDIPYNFLIGNDGRVYEGRGWNRVGAHTFGYNPCTLSIAFIGDYREGLPSYSKVTDLQLKRAQMLLAKGVELGYLQSDYHVVGQKDVIPTLSPGANLYREIQKWKNYNTQYAGKSCEAIHGVNETSVAAQTEALPSTFKNLKAAPHEWFITREMWLAPPFINQNATTEFAPLKLVIIAHTVSAECTVFMTCAAELRAIQSYFATEFEYDIPYNFLIGNEGRVYEGRGWNRVGAHTFGYNPCSLSIAFIGDYREGLPSYSKVTQLQLMRAQMLLAKGVELGYLQSDYHVVGQKDVITTLSPGANLYREIQKWKNYNTQYAGKSCEAIHGVNETIVAAQTEALPSTFKNLKAAPHEWFITREMWLAPPFINQNATTEFAPLKLVIIAHTVSAECTVFMNCAAELRAIQSYFATEFEYDIPYNFLIGNEGRVYEGRGWNRVGAHTFGYNPCSLSIAFIGDYREGLPSYSKVTQLQLMRAQMLLAKGVELGYLQSDYHVVGQKDVIPTLSPGANLYREIQKWKNYNTQYAGKSCEAIHGVNETIVAAQTEALPSTFKNLKAAPHEWFITREMWLAPPFINQNATTEFAPLKLVIIAHTLSAECTVFMTCAAELRALQSHFATEFEYDIPYNFLIGNEGRVYEGRGWNRVGAHTFGYNPCSLSIAFIGDYREGLPSYSKVTQLQLMRAQMLLAKGVELGYLQSDYHVVGQKDVIPTLSPGANLYREIQKWKNYNTQYAGKSCEAIHGVNETSVAAQTETPPPSFKNPTSNQSSDT